MLLFPSGISQSENFILLFLSAGNALFDASQYAFFGNDIVEEVDLGGGLEEEEEGSGDPVLGRFEAAAVAGNGGDEELHEYHLFDKDEVQLVMLCVSIFFLTSFWIGSVCISWKQSYIYIYI